MIRNLVTALGIALIILAVGLTFLLEPTPAQRVDSGQPVDRGAIERNHDLQEQVPEPTQPKRERPVAEPAPVGEPLATLRIPRFGKTWEWTVLEGTSDAVVADGPGHYRGTALPGEVGNAGFAAHRAGHGDPFIDFDLLVPGDRIHISQGKVTWTYEVTTKPEIIKPTDVWVLDRFAPGRWLTLTTCWPKYGSSHRMYIRARLV